MIHIHHWCIVGRASHTSSHTAFFPNWQVSTKISIPLILPEFRSRKWVLVSEFSSRISYYDNALPIFRWTNKMKLNALILRSSFTGIFEKSLVTYVRKICIRCSACFLKARFYTRFNLSMGLKHTTHYVKCHFLEWLSSDQQLCLVAWWKVHKSSPEKFYRRLWHQSLSHSRSLNKMPRSPTRINFLLYSILKYFWV